jgi:MFS family permease
MSAIAFLDRVNISIAGQALAREYKLSNQQLGYVFSAFVLGYALFQAPGGRLADRFGPRRVIALGVVWWGLFTTLTTLVPTGFALALPMLIVVRFVLGDVSVLEPAGGQLDSLAGTRHRQWPDLCGSGSRRRHYTSAHRLHHGALGLALVVLRQRAHRSGGGSGLVLDSPRHSARAPLDWSA